MAGKEVKGPGARKPKMVASERHWEEEKDPILVSSEVGESGPLTSPAKKGQRKLFLFYDIARIAKKEAGPSAGVIREITDRT